MALEPITRQEQIIAGKDLKPVTRMERFLKEYGGGSGGVTSWNDLSDRPFYRIEREPNICWIGKDSYDSDNADNVVADSGINGKTTCYAMPEDFLAEFSVGSLIKLWTEPIEYGSGEVNEDGYIEELTVEDLADVSGMVRGKIVACYFYIQIMFT